MTPIISTLLCLDGGHGVGTSTHAEELAIALRARGYSAEHYHHPRHPDGCDGAARVAWYVSQRGALADHLRTLGDDAPGVVVLDRGPLSGAVYARACGIDDGVALADCERWRAMGLCTRVLCAPWDVVRERLVSRGEDPAHAEAESVVWRALSSFHCDMDDLSDYVDGYVSTDQPVAAVTALLVDWSERVIRAAALERAR